MFCPSCGARNQAGARSCAECGRALPSARAPAAAASPGAEALAEAPATVADRAQRPPPSFSDLAATTVADRPTAAPGEPPRILRRPAPLAPAPVDVVPRNTAAASTTSQVAIDPDGPTLIRRPPGFEERMVGDIVRPPPRRETPAAVDGVAQRAAPRPAAPTVSAPGARPAPHSSLPPLVTSASLPVTPAQPTRATVPARPAVAPPPPPSPRPPPLPPETSPSIVLPPERARVDAAVAPADATTGSTAAVPHPERALPPPVLVLGSGWRLALARAVDATLMLAMAAATLYGSLLALGVRPAVQPVVDHAHAAPVPAALALFGAPFVAVALYQALTVLLLGGTFGGRLAGLRVVRLKDGARPGVVRALVRGVASALGTVLFCCGPLWGLLVDRRRRGLGDLVARSVTVRVGAGGAR